MSTVIPPDLPEHWPMATQRVCQPAETAPDGPVPLLVAAVLMDTVAGTVGGVAGVGWPRTGEVGGVEASGSCEMSTMPLGGENGAGSAGAVASLTCMPRNLEVMDVALPLAGAETRIGVSARVTAAAGTNCVFDEL